MRPGAGDTAAPPCLATIRTEHIVRPGAGRSGAPQPATRPQPGDAWHRIPTTLPSRRARALDAQRGRLAPLDPPALPHGGILAPAARRRLRADAGVLRDLRTSASAASRSSCSTCRGASSRCSAPRSCPPTRCCSCCCSVSLLIAIFLLTRAVRPRLVRLGLSRRRCTWSSCSARSSTGSRAARAARRSSTAHRALDPRRAACSSTWSSRSSALFLAHTFLAYFVGVDRLAPAGSAARRSSTRRRSSSCAARPALIFFDFACFREQTCLVACPYGRLQSVLLDRQSLIVGYDSRARRAARQGRQRPRRRPPVTASTAAAACTPARPGIDIRDGLQMECIHCTQCTDACDAVMVRVGKPRGLIRYGSRDGARGACAARAAAARGALSRGAGGHARRCSAGLLGTAATPR